MHVQYDTDPVVLEVADDGLDVGEVLGVIEALPGLQPRPHGAKSDHREAPGGQVPGVAGLQESLVIPGRLLPDQVDSVVNPQSSSTKRLRGVWSAGGTHGSLTLYQPSDRPPQSAWRPPSPGNPAPPEQGSRVSVRCEAGKMIQDEDSDYLGEDKTN